MQNAIINVLLDVAFQSFTHALYHLAAQPQYIQPIREEVERIIAEEGWTKPSMTKMRKLDSFMKESQRYTGIGMSAYLIRWFNLCLFETP